MTALTTTTGRVTIILPHPDKRGSAEMASRLAARPEARRIGRPLGRFARNASSAPRAWVDRRRTGPRLRRLPRRSLGEGGWMKLFYNAREWVG